MLGPNTDLSVRDKYEVIKPFKVEESKVMPWFGKEGMGSQLNTAKGKSMTIEDLVEAGYLKEVK